MAEEYKSRIGELKKRLYSRNNQPKATVFSDLKEKTFDVKEDWTYSEVKTPPEGPNGEDMAKKKQHSFLNKILIVSGLFLLVAIVYAGLSFGMGQGTISSDNIDIKVSGPISISAGEVLSLELSIKNNNNVDMELADLIVQYPEGTRDAKDISKELKRSRVSLGGINAGRKTETVIESVLFGEEGEKRVISIGIEYRVPSSNAIFFVEKEYEVEIISSPLSMIVDSPASVNAGEEIEFTLTITPNSVDEINRVLVVAEYPFGFQYQEGSGTEATFDNNIWEIKKLAPGEVKKIKIRGVMVGQNDEERTFRFVVGLPQEFDEKLIGTPFLTYSKSLSIQKPFLGLSLALNGSTAEESFSSIGSSIRGDLSWQNNLSSKIENVQMEVALRGDLLDRSSVSGGSGFFRSTDDTVVWDSRSIGNFASLGASETGSTGFSFKSLDISRVAGLFKNSSVILVAKISGDSKDESGVPERLVTTITKKITLSTVLNINAKAYYFSGPFINNGPLPPKVNQETTYTVVLSLSNALNNVTGARVRATLPAHARFMGTATPSTEIVTYNPIGGEIVWEAGDVAAGVGYSNPSREVSFQIAITPSLSQVGSAPNILINPRVEARDVVTDIQLNDSVSGQITTNIRGDSGFKTEYASVIE